MSVRVEWMGAGAADVELLAPGQQAEDGQAPDEGHHALVIGGAGVVAIEGTLSELNALSIKIRAEIIRALTGSRRG